MLYKPKLHLAAIFSHPAVTPPIEDVHIDSPSARLNALIADVSTYPIQE
jgi:hypothetical protein